MALITQNSTVELLQKALSQKGYSFEKFELKDMSYTRFIAPSGHAWLTQDAHVGYPFTSRAVAKISSEKDLAYAFCATHGVRVPRTVQLRKGFTDAELAELLVHKPLVVKPHNSSLSWGVSLNIRAKETLETAVAAALEFSPMVLVQEQIEGEELRFTVVNGKVKAVLLREMPCLTGDGMASIGQLLERENEARAELTMPYLTYPQLSSELIAETDRTSDDVLAEGEVLSLGRGTMIRTGASVYNVLPDVHSSYIHTAEKLAAKLGARFVVVDMMLLDHAAPQTDDNYAFIEFNTAPVLKLFYSCRDGRHYDIISDLVPMIDATLTGVSI